LIVCGTLGFTKQDLVTLNWDVPEYEYMDNEDQSQVHHILGFLGVGNVHSSVIETTTCIIAATHHLLEELMSSTTLSVKL
jgi:hypothetical protein